MDRLDAMHLFSRIVDLGSFKKAAEELQLPRASVSLAVQQLERHLDTRLLQRTTRQVSPTLEGQAYYLHCKEILESIEEAESIFRRSSIKPQGRLKVDLQGVQAIHFVLPRIGEFHKKYPNIELEISLGDRFVDLIKEGVDCVLRAGRTKDSSMVGRRVASLAQVTCASAEYLSERGVPSDLTDFQLHYAVNFIGANNRAMPFDFIVNGEPHRLYLNGPITVSNAHAYVACCCAGMGFIQVPRYHVAELIEQGKLVEVFPEWVPEPMPVSVMYPHTRHLSPRVRVFIDWIVDCMSVAK